MYKNKRDKKKMVGWFVGFYGISTFVGYLTPNPKKKKKKKKEEEKLTFATWKKSVSIFFKNRTTSSLKVIYFIIRNAVKLPPCYIRRNKWVKTKISKGFREGLIAARIKGTFMLQLSQEEENSCWIEKELQQL